MPVRAAAFALLLLAGCDSTPTPVEPWYVGKGNDRLEDRGAWIEVTGAPFDPRAVVYRLDRPAPAEFRSFWAIGQDILFVLDPAGRPRVGDAGYGYALNRTR